MRTFLSSCVLTVLSLACAPASAQCTIKSAVFKSYGAGCTSVFSTAPALAGKFDSTNCRLLLDIAAYGGCCNTFLRDRVFVFGVAATKAPVPFFGTNCVLLARTDFIVMMPASAGSTLSIPLPKGVATGTVFVQGAAHYFTTINRGHNYQLTNGLSVTIK